MENIKNNSLKQKELEHLQAASRQRHKVVQTPLSAHYCSVKELKDIGRRLSSGESFGRVIENQNVFKPFTEDFAEENSLDYIKKQLPDGRGFICCINAKDITRQQKTCLIPNTPGIYWLWCEKVNLVYIGSTMKMRDRICSHIYRPFEKEFKYVTWFDLDLTKSELESGENKMLIKALRVDALPAYNKSIRIMD